MQQVTGERIAGLVLARPGRLLGMEPFMADVVQGIEEVFDGRRVSLLIEFAADIADEIATWQRWVANDHVDGVVMVDLRANDARLAELERLGVPAVLLGGPELQAPITNVLVDNAEGARAAVRALADLGHRDIARVSGPRDMLHCQARDDAFMETCVERDVQGRVIEGDYSEDAGREATRRLLTGSQVPTAVVYDNDLMAIGGLAAAKDLGVRIPDQLSVIAWDDTAVARLAHPPLSVVTVDVHGLGTIVGEAILAVMQGGEVTTYQVPKPTIRLAQSTAEPGTRHPAEP
ncbi:DNA-binding LacI/PurR family transcriptional regulator [Kribbella sp. VKM Ac-2571]|uniref:LacI family DNA-binding transcriptional regulator n=1 Tax=Kribbella sp. VKM Ac-2571 TaxID=2512222 RepID=UPI001060ADF4|nr:substrate-binding domain-containing protein [Kribbella sp. VKM Ac-2571]TDO50319.1 DNA-binding LacI/PurR family transcriptional regulator [Kribbella sp. VKM Ac-2571]